MIRITCLALALTALAACDSAAPPTETPPTIPPPTTPGSTPPPGTAPSITYTAPPTSLVGEEDGRGLAVSLASLFQTAGDVGAITYAASPASGAIAARIDGDSLRIALVSAGTGFVSVTATGASGARASGDIPVRSTGRCPGVVAPGQVELIPAVAENTEWRFDLASSEALGIGLQSRTTGTVVLRFGTSQCSDGARTQSVAQTATTQRQALNPQTGQWDPPAAPQTVATSIEWTTTDTETRSNAPAVVGRNPNAIPPFGPSVARSVDASRFSSGFYIDDHGGGAINPTVRFDRAVGLRSFLATTYYGTAGFGQITWERTLP